MMQKQYHRLVSNFRKIRIFEPLVASYPNRGLSNLRYGVSNTKSGLPEKNRYVQKCFKQAFMNDKEIAITMSKFLVTVYDQNLP